MLLHGCPRLRQLKDCHGEVCNAGGIGSHGPSIPVVKRGERTTPVAACTTCKQPSLDVARQIYLSCSGQPGHRDSQDVTILMAFCAGRRCCSPPIWPRSVLFSEGRLWPADVLISHRLTEQARQAAYNEEEAGRTAYTSPVFPPPISVLIARYSI